MIIATLLVAHVAILGYWLGAELVINASFRFVCLRTDLPFASRDAVINHVMDVDQHVRYALALQLTLGLVLAFLLGYLPGQSGAAWLAVAGGGLWLLFIEVVHRRRTTAIGASLASIDRGSRYVLLVLLVLPALGLTDSLVQLPGWLRVKLVLFAAVIACGIGIRRVVIRFFRLWAELAYDGATAERNAAVLNCYMRATGILVCLWCFIATITFASIAKPW